MLVSFLSILSIMFGGQGNTSGAQGSKNPYASSQASKSLSATFSSQNAATGPSWQNRGNSGNAGNSSFGSPAPSFGGSFSGNAGSFGAVAATQSTTGFGSFATPSPATGGEVASSSGWKSSTPGSFSLSSNKGPSSHTFGSSHNSSTFAPASAQHTYKCRMCQSVFPSSEELKRHIKAEGHFDTSRVLPASGGGSGGTNGGSFGANHPPQSVGHSKFEGPSTTQSVQGPFSQPHSTPFGHSGQPRGPRGSPSPFTGAGGGSAPPRTQQPWGLKGHSSQSSQDVRQLHSQQPNAPHAHTPPSHDRQTHGQPPQAPPHHAPPSFGDTPSSLGQQSHGQQSQGQPRYGQPYGQQPPRPRGAFGQSGPGGHFGANQSQSQGYGQGQGQSQSHNQAPNSSASRPPADPHPFRAPRGSLAPTSNTQSVIAQRSIIPLTAVPESTSTASDDAASGDDGDRASDGDYTPAQDQNQGTADEDDADGDEEEEDDLNFSFSSQESGVGDGANSTHSSPMKGPGLGSPAAAARSRAEQIPQRALFDQTRASAVPASAGASSATPAAAQGGAVSSLMGFMKTSSKFPAATPQAAARHTPSAQSSGSSAHGSDTESTSSDGTDAMGTCEDMCPAEERQKRVNESDIHKLEIPHAEMTPGRPDLSLTMVKKFQRSSADHALQIPHLLRTPEALLRTIEYIENELMDRAAAGVVDPRIGEAPTTLFIYLFVWDRYRMVAKDFTLQQSVLPLTRVWVECHERMARWFILMDHKMQAADDFISAGHGQQNGEQLNNLLKTLHGYYFRSRAVADTSTSSSTSTAPAVAIDMPNKAEFVCYFVIFQLGNGGEVSKYLQQLPDEVLNSEQVRFAIEVWGALKTQNYAKYFRLLRTRATLLQACLMHRYVGEVRLSALKKLTRSLNPPGTKPQEYLLRDLMRLFMFESVPEAAEFIEHCGLTLCPSSASGLSPEHVSAPDEDFVVLLSGQNIDHLLPRDKNDRAILPSTSYMGEAIDRVKALKQGSTTVCYSIAEVCRGFATGGSQPVFAPAARVSSTATTTGATKTAEFGVRIPMTKGVSPATVPSSSNNAANEAKNRLLTQGLGSARGPKPPHSPIPPVSEDDLWGPDIKPSGSEVHGAKKITPQAVHKNFDGSAVTSASQSKPAFAFGSPQDPSLPTFEKKGIIAQFKKKEGNTADQRSGSFGTGSGSTSASGSGSESGSSWGGKKTFGAPPGSTGASGWASDASKQPPTTSATPQDSWRRAAPVAARDAPKEGSFGGSGSGNKAGRGQEQTGQGKGQGQKVSSFGTGASAFPAFPAPTLPTDPFSTTSSVPPIGTASAWKAPKVSDPVPDSTDKSAFFPAPSPATPSALSAAISSFSASVPAPAPAPAPAVVPSAEATHSFISKNFTSGLNPNSASFVPAARKNSEDTGKASFLGVTPVAVESAPAARRSFPDAFISPAATEEDAAVIIDRSTSKKADTVSAVDPAKLKAFQEKITRIESIRAQKSVLSNWRSVAQSAREQCTKRIAALYFLFWKQSHRRSLRARESFLTDIKGIKLVDPLVQGLGGLNIFGSENTDASANGGNLLKRKQAQTAETQRQLNAIAETEAQVRYSLLCDATSSSAEAVVTTTSVESEAVQRSRGTKSLLDVVARTLRATKTCQLRSLLGLPVGESTLQTLADGDASAGSDDGPVYCGALSFKVAFVSDCTVAGVACKHSESSRCSCGGLSTSLRAQLANERGYGYTVSSDGQSMSKAQLAKMKKRRGLLARALATRDSTMRVVRVGLHSHALDTSTSLQLSVLDSCGKGAVRLETIDARPDLTAQVEAVSDLTGIQAAVLVIHAHSAFSINAVLNRALFCAQQSIPVVVVLFRPRHPTQNVEEVSRTEILHALNPSPTCQAVRKVLKELQSFMHPERPDWMETVQACIVVSGTTQDSPAGAREVLRRALPLLAAAAAPTPAVTRVRPADWVLRQLHSVGVEASAPAPFIPANGELREQQLRGLGHEALAAAIDRTNSQLTKVASALRQILSTSQTHTGRFPPFDFLTGAGYFPAGVLNLSALSRIANSTNSTHSTHSTSGSAAAESDLHLPSNWLEVSQLQHVADVVDSLSFPRWSSADSIAAYQAVLVQFPTGKTPGEGGVCAGNFVAALDDVLNSAYTSGQVAHLPVAMDAVLEGITRERLDGLSEGILPAYLYLPLEKPGSLLELLQPAPGPRSDVSVTSAAESVDSNHTSAEASVLMSPGSSTYFDQSQYSQTFPTGFGRSLFAQFNRDSVCLSANSSPITDHKTKRAFDTDLSDADEYARAHERRDSTASAEGRRASGASQPGNISSVSDSTHKRAKYNGEDGEGGSRFGIAYEKLFGESKSPTPSTPAGAGAAMSADPTTRALQSELHREQAAADRLTSMLQAALSPVRSPLGVSRTPATPGTTGTTGGGYSTANTPFSTNQASAPQPRSDSKQALQDPMQFIEQCRRERERFDAAVVTL